MPEMSQSEVDALGGFRLIAQKYGGTPHGILQKIEDLEKDNREYRQEKIPALEAKIPKDNEVVIPKSKADALAEYEALGKPSEIKAKLESGENASVELKGLQLRTAAAKYAEAAGLAAEAVDTLIAIPALQGATFEVKAGKTKNDKGEEVDAQIAYVTLPGEGQSAIPHTEAIEKVPALKGLRPAAPVKDQQPPRSFVPQGGQQQEVKDEKPSTYVEQAIANNRKAASAPNPLRPSKT